MSNAGTVITLPDSGRPTTVTTPDLFDLALRPDLPNPVLAGVQRMVLATAVGAGIATADEIAAYNAEPDGAGALDTIRWLIEDNTSNPQLVADMNRARDMTAQGIGVDLQHRYSARDLFFVYDHILGRGGRFYRAMFPDTEQEPASAVLGVAVAQGANGRANKRTARPRKRAVVGVSGG